MLLDLEAQEGVYGFADGFLACGNDHASAGGDFFVRVLNAGFEAFHCGNSGRHRVVDEHRDIESPAAKLFAKCERCARIDAIPVLSSGELLSTSITPPVSVIKKWCVVAVCEKPMACSPRAFIAL